MSEMTLPSGHRIRNSKPVPEVWGRARYLSVTEAPHDIEFYEWMGNKHFCVFQTAEIGKRTTTLGPPLMMILNWKEKTFGLHGLYKNNSAL